MPGLELPAGSLGTITQAHPGGGFGVVFDDDPSKIPTLLTPRWIQRTDRCPTALDRRSTE